MPTNGLALDICAYEWAGPGYMCLRMGWPWIYDALLILANNNKMNNMF